MTRPRTFPRTNGNDEADGAMSPVRRWLQRPQRAPEVLTVPTTGSVERHYVPRPPRPILQLAVRILLWGAVTLGAVGGIVGLLRPPPATPVPVIAPSPSTVDIPAPVASVAEQAVQQWLTASDQEDRERLAALFIEPPALPDGAREGEDGELTVGRLTTVAGRVMQEGSWWSVDVAAEVTESVPVVEGSDDASVAPDPAAPTEQAGEATRTSTWYVQVTIVGHVDTGLAALTTPAIMPTGPSVSTGWRATRTELRAPEPDSMTSRTVEGFFDALLAGQGDPSRYLSPGVDVTSAEAPMFADTEVAALAADQAPDGRSRILAQLTGVTPGGARRPLTYELLVVERIDRLEIVQFAGAPTLLDGSADPPDSSSATAERPEGPETSESRDQNGG